MAKDYKNASKPKRKAQKATPGWLWMLGGLSIGLFVAVLVYLKDDFLEKTARNQSAPVADKGQLAAESPALEVVPAQATPARFDFYKLLPEMEVFIPPQEPAEQRQQKTADTFSYYLQVGSFRQFADADRLRAQLALKNIESHIQRASIKGNQAWHRVRVGPFHSARKMDIVKNRLRAQSLDPIVLKRKQPQK
jgi:cell division protein FtsN